MNYVSRPPGGVTATPPLADDRGRGDGETSPRVSPPFAFDPGDGCFGPCEQTRAGVSENCPVFTGKNVGRPTKTASPLRVTLGQRHRPGNGSTTYRTVLVASAIPTTTGSSRWGVEVTSI